MPCELLTFVDGSSGWLCMPKPEPEPCIVCGEPASLLCDGPDPEDVDGTCSALLCARHARKVGDRDLCPSCASPDPAFVMPKRSAAR